MNTKDRLNILFEQIKKVFVDDYYAALEGGYTDGWNDAVREILSLSELSENEYPAILRMIKESKP